jgi:cardiolipin synthase
VVETSCHPLRTGMTIASQSAQGLWTVSRGAYGKRIALPLSAPPQPLSENRGRLDVMELEADLDHLLGASVQRGDVHLWPDGGEALTTLKQMLAGAQRRIDVLMFQWENDTLGAELATLLAEKAGPDLRVRILVDGGGNLIFGAPVHAHAGDVNGVVTKLANQPYVEVIRTRNPFGWVDHRKLVVVDGRCAWTGGRNFTHKSFFEQRDLSATLEGPVVTALAKDFDGFWVEQGGGSSSELGARSSELKDAPRSAFRAPSSTVRTIYTLPRRHQIEQVLYNVVDRARHHVFIENYTFCDGLLVYKLAQARQRGVDVRVVLTFSDCTAALNHANRAIANRLLAAGVRVYVYPGMTHAKVATVDGCWAYVGSGNFDPLSLRRNYELGLALGNPAIVGEIEQNVFDRDFCPAWELTAPLQLSFRDYACEILASLCL